MLLQYKNTYISGVYSIISNNINLITYNNELTGKLLNIDTNFIVNNQKKQIDTSSIIVKNNNQIYSSDNNLVSNISSNLAYNFYTINNIQRIGSQSDNIKNKNNLYEYKYNDNLFQWSNPFIADSNTLKCKFPNDITSYSKIIKSGIINNNIISALTYLQACNKICKINISNNQQHYNIDLNSFYGTITIDGLYNNIIYTSNINGNIYSTNLQFKNLDNISGLTIKNSIITLSNIKNLSSSIYNSILYSNSNILSYLNNTSSYYLNTIICDNLENDNNFKYIFGNQLIQLKYINTLSYKNNYGIMYSDNLSSIYTLKHHAHNIVFNNTSGSYFPIQTIDTDISHEQIKAGSEKLINTKSTYVRTIEHTLANIYSIEFYFTNWLNNSDGFKPKQIIYGNQQYQVDFISFH